MKNACAETQTEAGRKRHMDTQGSEEARGEGVRRGGEGGEGGEQVNKDQVILMRLISAGRRGTRAGSAKQMRGRHFQKETNQNLNTKKTPNGRKWNHKNKC